ncbi:MAG TPA: hypothetical protein VIO64_18770 [Pseudobacteroides sp.]|uniref:hypothetical protein n=1 Tax=Pseudobacteroides sp. TaxID=1968840 RepID=UPI002F922DC9
MEGIVNYCIYDLKYGDVYGDKNTDAIFLIGEIVEYKGATYTDKIILIIQDSRTGMFSGVPLESGLGNRPRLFLGDFNNDGICEMFIRIDAENVVAPGAFYIFSYKCSILRLIFDYKEFNNQSKFKTTYLDGNRVEIAGYGCNNQADG